jgi:hypothetical protein
MLDHGSPSPHSAVALGEPQFREIDMSNDLDDFDIEFTGPGDSAGNIAKRATGGFWCRAPCVNSVEHELIAMRDTHDPLTAGFGSPLITFTDANGDEEPTTATEHEIYDDRIKAIDAANPDSKFKAAEASATPELLDVRSQLCDLYGQHIALARSLGEGATWADYEIACRNEGIEPFKRVFK